jgi:hypothetical protein
MININIDKKTNFILFCIVFISVCLFLNYQTYFFLSPRGIHFIRQTDSLSFINYYCKTGFNFFNIGNLNLYNSTGKTACEFPLIYYIVALFTKTGIKSFLLMKFIHLFLFFYTTFSLLNFFKRTLSLINSYASVFLIFSSTISLFYTLNYIPNYIALCLTICALINFLSFLESNNPFEFKLSILFFLFASLFKVTFAIYPIGCLIYFVLQFFKFKKINYKIVVSFSIIFVLIFLWNYFVLYYNQINNADYYLTAIKPIWNSSFEERRSVISFILNYWLYQYYFQSTIHFFGIVLFISLFFYKKINLKIVLFSLILFIGLSCYFILFFKQFKDHDYYFLEFIPFFMILFINSFPSIINCFNSYCKISVSLLLVIISILSINYGRINLERRYSSANENKIPFLENIENRIDEIGISPDAKITVIPDYTMNGSLYYLNRFGYTIGDTSDVNLPKFCLKSDYILILDSLIKPSLIKKFKLKKCNLIFKGFSLYELNIK